MSVEPITRIRLQRFTAFEDLDLQPSPGINVLTGVNGAGKTHLMKVMYAACKASKDDVNFASKLQGVFMPWQGRIGRMARRRQGGARTSIRVERGDRYIRASFGTRTVAPHSAVVRTRRWMEDVSSAYIPVKEMLANAPGFVSLYDRRDLHFEEVYRDILELAALPPYRGAPDAARRHLLKQLRECLGGSVAMQNETFFLKSRQGNLEFALLAEGLRKLGLLWVLIQNGTFTEGATLFWDEPETNLNPELFDKVVRVLLELQRTGVQVFFATHDYVLLKQLDLQTTTQDAVKYHALFLDESGAVACRSVANYVDLDPNAIAAAYADLYDLEIDRTLGWNE